LNKRVLIIALLLFSFILSLGTLAYMFLEGWSFLDSLYMTVLITTTIGFQEVHPLSESGVIFTIAFSLIGFFFFAGFISIFSSNLVEQFIIDRKGEKKMLNKVKKMKDHIIVCGSGKLGRHVIKILAHHRKSFVVLDQGDHMTALQEDYNLKEENSKTDLLAITGDPTKEEALQQAGVERAYGLVSCMPEDAQNLFIGVTSKKLNPEIKWSTIVIDEKNSNKFFTLGADDVIRGDYVIGNRLANSLVNQNLFGFLEQTNPIDGSTSLIVGAILIGKDSPLKQKEIRFSNINQELGLLILAIKKNHLPNYQLNPLPQTVMEEGDVLISLGDPQQIQKLENFVNPKKGLW